MRMLPLLALLLVFGLPLSAQYFPSDNGIALLGIHEFDAAVLVRTWLNMEGDRQTFQDNVQRDFILSLRRDGIKVDKAAPNYLICNFSGTQRDTIIGYVWRVEYYEYNPEGLHQLLWMTGGIVSIGRDLFSAEDVAEECGDAFANEWLK